MGLLISYSHGGYHLRTQQNAKSSDLTVALAVDFDTSGERLTRQMAGDFYLGVLIDKSYENMPDHWCVSAAEKISIACASLNARRLNFAGNGAYTLARRWALEPQASANALVLRVLAELQKRWRVDLVRSGGQTGIDEAAIRCAVHLGINAHAHLPAGGVYRDARGYDHCATPEETRARLTAPL